MDLARDIEKICKCWLQNNGFDIDQVKNNAFLITYLNYEHRLLPVKPRNVHIAKTFSCPKEHQEGFDKFIALVENGGDLTPYMTKRLKEITSEKNDYLLLDWHIYHFHLGVNNDTKQNHFIQRTGELLFVFSDDNDFYCLEIKDHKSFENKNLLEIINANWPELLDNNRISNAKLEDECISEEEIKKLRQNQLNVMHSLSDGSIVSNVGGGITSAGTSVECTLKAIKIKKHLKKIQKFFESSDSLADVEKYLKNEGRIFQIPTDIRLLEYSDNVLLIADYANKYCCALEDICMEKIKTTLFRISDINKWKEIIAAA